MGPYVSSLSFFLRIGYFIPGDFFRLKFFKSVLGFVFSIFFAVCCVASFLDSDSAAAENSLSVSQLLSAHHPVFELDTLVKAAGSEDDLVSELIRLRLFDKPPVLGINAQKVLLNFQDRDDVRSAFLEDVSDTSRLGLSSVILSRLDDISDDSFRYKLAKRAISLVSSSASNRVGDESSIKSSSEPEIPDFYKDRIKNFLQSSSDPSIKSLVTNNR
ncbi:MAG TPA: hypothetical protein PKA63_04245 [Oligoflexia bacterium]|nr:hypothetical protein [Oligoflexia bacterium]HMP47860.1 hypothetical protein [Oligoflexia bacterium]